MTSAARNLDIVLASGRARLPSLRRRVKFLQQVQAAVDSVLPPAAHAEVRVADCEHGRLLLIASSGVWATRLRFQHPALRRVIAQRLRRDVADVEVRVRPSAVAAPVRQRRPRVLSAVARRCLRETAAHVTDPEVAAALARLSRAGDGAGDGENDR